MNDVPSVEKPTTPLPVHVLTRQMHAVQPAVDGTEDDEPEGEKELVELKRNKFAWQAGDIQIIRNSH